MRKTNILWFTCLLYCQFLVKQSWIDVFVSKGIKGLLFVSLDYEYFISKDWINVTLCDKKLYAIKHGMDFKIFINNKIHHQQENYWDHILITKK